MRNLIFLIGLPRSGTTMLQKILCSNQYIHTTSEPWVMLHPLYALREQGYSAEYNQQWAYKALQIFLDEIPDGEDTYYEGLRLMFAHIYKAALNESGGKFFLDKTPRYYEIIPELHKVFPAAKFVVLVRSPLAVFSSRINLLPDRKGGKELKGLSLYNRDLLYGPEKLMKGVEVLGDNCIVLKYEDFVLHPDFELKKICDYIGIKYSSSMLEYNKDDSLPMQFGDPVNVYKNVRPNAEYRGKWVESLGDPQLWRLFSEYIDILGNKLVNDMGYSSLEIRNVIDRSRHGRFKLLFTNSLSNCLRLARQ